MTSRPPLIREAAWSHWYRRALPAYWIFIFCATHFPNLRLGSGYYPSDKLLHTLAFALLAFFFWKFAETLRKPLSGWFVWRAGLWLIAYAAFDESTQALVGRRVDYRDWLANACGIVVVLALLEIRRRIVGVDGPGLCVRMRTYIWSRTGRCTACGFRFPTHPTTHCPWCARPR